MTQFMFYADFMTPLKKRMLRHSLAEERPSQYLLPKPEGTSLFDSSVNLTQPVAMEQPLLEVKEEEEEERGDDINEEVWTSSNLLLWFYSFFTIHSLSLLVCFSSQRRILYLTKWCFYPNASLNCQ